MVSRPVNPRPSQPSKTNLAKNSKLSRHLKNAYLSQKRCQIPRLWFWGILYIEPLCFRCFSNKSCTSSRGCHQSRNQQSKVSKATRRMKSLGSETGPSDHLRLLHIWSLSTAVSPAFQRLAPHAKSAGTVLSKEWKASGPHKGHAKPVGARSCCRITTYSFKFQKLLGLICPQRGCMYRYTRLYVPKFDEQDDATLNKKC